VQCEVSYHVSDFTLIKLEQNKILKFAVLKPQTRGVVTWIYYLISIIPPRHYLGILATNRVTDRPF